MSDSGTRRGTQGRSIVSAVAVVALTALSLLLSVGFASADTASDGDQDVAVPVAHLLGLPMGTAIWALLGLLALVAGSLVVGRTRSPQAPSGDLPVPALLAGEGAVAAV